MAAFAPSAQPQQPKGLRAKAMDKLRGRSSKEEEKEEELATSEQEIVLQESKMKTKARKYSALTNIQIIAFIQEFRT